MAYDIEITGTPGVDNLFYFSKGEVSLLLESLKGDDIVRLNTDLSNSSINLDGGDDDLLITSTTSVNPTFRQSVVRSGGGNDTIVISTRNGADLQIWGDLGADNIQLTHVGDGKGFSQVDNASFVRTTILGDDLDGVGGGVDTVYIDNHVARFNQSFVNLNGNGNGIIAPVEDAVIDAIAKGDTLGLLDLGLEGMLVQAGEVFESTFRGGTGSDWIVFDSLFNDFAGAAGTTPLDSSFINGNEDADAIAILRDLDNTTVRGGEGNDYLTVVNGTARNSLFNGNQGADLINIVGILADQSTFYGGIGDDVITVASAVTNNSLISGDDGDDAINFLALNSTDTTMRGGEGDDTIDDFSTAITSLGNLLDGGAGDDVLTQAANIILSGVTDFASTFIGGTGADVMTGENSGQPLGPKEADVAGTAISGASKDLFRFSYGDSEINRQGVGHDQITDLDSNASFYLFNTGDSTNPFDYTVSVADPLVDNLTPLERDAIDLTNGNIKFGISTVLPDGGGAVAVNSKGLVLSGVDNITEFVLAGSQQTTAGAALVWTETADPFTTPMPFDVDEFRTSWLFISDGDGVLTNQDLLVELTNVAFGGGTGGMVINGGNITDLVTA